MNLTNVINSPGHYTKKVLQAATKQMNMFITIKSPPQPLFFKRRAKVLLEKEENEGLSREKSRMR